MDRRETSNQTLELHYCVVEEVHENGLVTVRSKKGRRFNKVNVVRPGTEFSPEPGRLVALISDGTQHLVLGEFPEKTEGNYRQSDHDLDDLEQAKTIIAQDELGNQARVIVSPGAGIILDAGNYSTVQYDVAENKLTEYLERHEQIMPALYKLVEHDGTNCRTQYHYRTKVNRDVMEKNLDHESPKNQIGQNVKIDISPPSGQGEVCQVELANGKQSNLEITMKKDGSFILESDSKVEIKSTQDKVRVESQSGTKVLSGQDTEVAAQGTVFLGKEKGKGFFQKVAMAPKTKTNIRKVKTAYDGHTHEYIPPLLPLPVPIPTTPVAPAPPLTNISSDNTKAKTTPIP